MAYLRRDADQVFEGRQVDLVFGFLRGHELASLSSGVVGNDIVGQLDRTWSAAAG